MSSTLEISKKINKEPNWKVIMNYSQAEIKSKNPCSTSLIKRSNMGIKKKLGIENNETGLEMACSKLKNDLEWYNNLSENDKSQLIISGLSIESGTTDSALKLAENWWLSV